MFSFSLLGKFQTDSAAQPSFHAMDEGVISMGIKRPALEADNLSRNNAAVRKICVYTSTSQYVFIITN
jgi:hypothetical protein